MADWERNGAAGRDSGVAVFLQVGIGVFLVFALHAIVGGLLFALVWVAGQFLSSEVLIQVQMASAAWMAGISCAQFLYVLPVGIASWFVRRPIALGTLIGAGLTILLQGSCYALMLGVAGVGSW